MKNIRVFLFETFQFLEGKFSMYLNRRVFVMSSDRSEAVLPMQFFFVCIKARRKVQGVPQSQVAANP